MDNGPASKQSKYHITSMAAAELLQQPGQFMRQNFIMDPGFIDQGCVKPGFIGQSFVDQRLIHQSFVDQSFTDQSFTDQRLVGLSVVDQSFIVDPKFMEAKRSLSSCSK